MNTFSYYSFMGYWVDPTSWY